MTCVNLTPEEQAQNNSKGYRCEEMFNSSSPAMSSSDEVNPSSSATVAMTDSTDGPSTTTQFEGSTTQFDQMTPPSDASVTTLATPGPEETSVTSVVSATSSDQTSEVSATASMTSVEALITSGETSITSVVEATASEETSVAATTSMTSATVSDEVSATSVVSATASDETSATSVVSATASDEVSATSVVSATASDEPSATSVVSATASDETSATSVVSATASMSSVVAETTSNLFSDGTFETSVTLATTLDPTSTPNILPTSSDTKPATSRTVTEAQTTESPVTTEIPVNINQEVRLEVSFNVNSSRCKDENWKGKINNKFKIVHGKNTRIDKCAAGSAVISYAVLFNNDVTDQERTTTVNQLLSAIDPSTNSLTVDGDSIPINENPVLLLGSDNTRVEISDYCSVHKSQYLCQNRGYCEVSDNTPICRCAKSWNGTYCETAVEPDDNGSETILIVSLSVAGFIASVSLLVVVVYMLKGRNKDRGSDDQRTIFSASDKTSPKTRYQDWYRGWSPEAAWMRHQGNRTSSPGYYPAGYHSNTMYGQQTNPRRTSGYGQGMATRQYGYPSGGKYPRSYY